MDLAGLQQHRPPVEVGHCRNDLATHYLDWLDLVHADHPAQCVVHSQRTEPAQPAEQLRCLRAVYANVERKGRGLLDRVVVSAAFITQALQEVELARQFVWVGCCRLFWGTPSTLHGQLPGDGFLPLTGRT